MGALPPSSGATVGPLLPPCSVLGAGSFPWLRLRPGPSPGSLAVRIAASGSREPGQWSGSGRPRRPPSGPHVAPACCVPDSGTFSAGPRWALGPLAIKRGHRASCALCALCLLSPLCGFSPFVLLWVSPLSGHTVYTTFLKNGSVNLRVLFILCLIFWKW